MALALQRFQRCFVQWRFEMTMTKASIWALILLASCPFALAQQENLRPNPSLPADVLGPQLIMWTQMQKPQPLPQPLPPPERADQQQQASPQPGSAPAQAEPATQSFTGTIVKDGSRYVLKVSDSTTYQIDDQERAKTFEGKQVKVSGSLDSRLNVLHITSIELLS